VLLAWTPLTPLKVGVPPVRSADPFVSTNSTKHVSPAAVVADRVIVVDVEDERERTVEPKV
jgi:hypothetical protein